MSMLRSTKLSILLFLSVVNVILCEGDEVVTQFESQLGKVIMLNWTRTVAIGSSSFRVYKGDNMIRRLDVRGGPEIKDERMRFRFPTTNLVGLEIDDVRLEDAGLYHVEGEDISLEKILLIIRVKPDKPTVLWTNSNGQWLTLTCKTMLGTLPANQRRPIVVTWYREGKPIANSDPGHIISGAQLSISRSYIDGNNESIAYQCSARENNTELESDKSDEVTLSRGMNDGERRKNETIITVVTVICIVALTLSVIVVVKYKSKLCHQVCMSEVRGEPKISIRWTTNIGDMNIHEECYTAENVFYVSSDNAADVGGRGQHVYPKREARNYPELTIIDNAMYK